eukprot:m.7736 g.7736  ORF g.7736 m.7736 type:complete len:360 (+) comp5290_c0_seq1:31-1110(+)
MARPAPPRAIGRAWGDLNQYSDEPNLISRVISKAAEEHDVAAVKRAIEHYRHFVNISNGHGWTPLRTVVSCWPRKEVEDVLEILEIVDALLRHGANQRLAARKGGIAPLHEAVRLGLLPVIQCMLEADPGMIHVKTFAGLYPLHYACGLEADNVMDIVRFLLEREEQVQGGDVPERLRLINAKTEAGLAPLHYASENRSGHSLELVQLLVDNGGDIHALTKEGNTPAHYAGATLQRNILQLLVDMGCNPFVRNTTGRTAYGKLFGEDLDDNRRRLPRDRRAWPATPQERVVLIFPETSENEAEEIIKSMNENHPKTWDDRALKVFELRLFKPVRWADLFRHPDRAASSSEDSDHATSDH